MKTFLVFAVLLMGLNVRADTTQVVNVRRNITISDTDPVYKDFYINGGTNSGFKKGQTLVASRKINVRDSAGSSTIGEMTVPVGELTVIAVYEKVTVARESKLFDRKDLPMLEQKAIMTGDLIDVKK